MNTRMRRARPWFIASLITGVMGCCLLGAPLGGGGSRGPVVPGPVMIPGGEQPPSQQSDPGWWGGDWNSGGDSGSNSGSWDWDDDSGGSNSGSWNWGGDSGGSNSGSWNFGGGSNGGSWDGGGWNSGGGSNSGAW